MTYYLSAVLEIENIITDPPLLDRKFFIRHNKKIFATIVCNLPVPRIGVRNFCFIFNFKCFSIQIVVYSNL